MSQPKTIFITGATSGIGRHAAVYLSQKGHRVIASGRNLDALEALRKEAGVDVVRLDVTYRDSIARAEKEVRTLTEGRGLDVLINNAGYGLAAPLMEIDDADLRAQFETNVFGLMNVTHAFLPLLVRAKKARILNVSSIGGRTTFPLFGAYHATKYAVEALSDALRMELAPFHIDVVLIEPGPIRTGFAHRTMALLDKYRSNTNSPYASVYAKAESIQAAADKRAASPLATSRAIERAITARRPRARYVVPFSSRVMLFFLGMMPTRLKDAVTRKVLGLSHDKLPTPRPEQLQLTGES